MSTLRNLGSSDITTDLNANLKKLTYVAEDLAVSVEDAKSPLGSSFVRGFERVRHF